MYHKEYYTIEATQRGLNLKISHLRISPQRWQKYPWYFHFGNGKSLWQFGLLAQLGLRQCFLTVKKLKWQYLQARALEGVRK